jgi:hemolysin-activating ACP:hemolysin acyltransferase
MVDAASHAFSRAFGKIQWQLAQLPIHKHFNTTTPQETVMPPMLLNQLRIFCGDTQPTEFAFWAFFSKMRKPVFTSRQVISVRKGLTKTVKYNGTLPTYASLGQRILKSETAFYY